MRPRSRLSIEGAVVHMLLVVVCGYVHPTFDKEES